MTEPTNEPAEPTRGPTNEELRAVPVDVLRDWFVDRVERSSVRAVAVEAGLGRTTLWKFVAGDTQPQPRVRRLLALLYLRMRGQTDAMEDGEDARTALAILAGYFPPAGRAAFIADVLGVLERGFLAGGRTPPRWIERLRSGL